MGYTTTFYGRFDLDKPLTEAEAAYLRRFSRTRRMQRIQVMLNASPDPWRIAVGLPVGEEGAYYTGGEDDTDWENDIDDPSVLDDSEPPFTQPSLWCDWVPTADLQGIEWNGREKFYEYGAWLHYLIEHFLRPWGYTLSGRVTYQGQDAEDRGWLAADNNSLSSSDPDLFE